jgi:hypothetical protein
MVSFKVRALFTAIVGFQAISGVLAQLSNVALNKGGSLSSNDSIATRPVTLATDGVTSGANPDGTLPNMNIAHTGINPIDPSWAEIELEAPYIISEINVYDRVDDRLERLRGFKLQVFDGVTETFTFTDPTTSGDPPLKTSIPVSQVVGDRVRITARAAVVILQLAEVQVFGVPPNNVNTRKTHETSFFGTNTDGLIIGGAEGNTLGPIKKILCQGPHCEAKKLFYDELVPSPLDLNNEYTSCEFTQQDTNENCSNRQVCPPGMVVNHIACKGKLCYENTIKCAPFIEGSGITVGSETVDTTRFSEENTNGWSNTGECPEGKFLVGLECKANEGWCDVQIMICADVTYGDWLTTSVGNVAGDPHVVPFSGPPFSYHGHCDLVMMSSASEDLDLHIRTTRVDKPHMSYSYISGAAVRVGTDVVEVMDDGVAFLNGIDAEDLFLERNDVLLFGGSFRLTKKMKGTNQNIFVYNLTLHSDGGDQNIQIRANTKTGMIFVDAIGSTFPLDSVGLLGAPDKAAMLARDGETDLSGHWNALGEQWQVRSDEPKLFKDKNRAPQYPAGCIYKDQSVNKKSNLRRRLVDVVSSVSAETAEKACSHASGTKKEFCIDDVMASGDIELASDPFYGGSYYVLAQ